MRQRRVVINPIQGPAPPNFMNEIPQKFHTRYVKMLVSDWTTYFVYPQNNRGNPFLVRQQFSDWMST